MSCDKYTLLQKEIQEQEDILKEYKLKCDEELFKEITTYFEKRDESYTNVCLLKALFKYYQHKKKENEDYYLSFRQFIDLFPRDTTIKPFNFRKQHVFEVICKLLLFLNYDSQYFGKTKKIFYKSLESYTKGLITPLTTEEILTQKINEGSASESVDIFFSVSGKEEIDSNKLCGYREEKTKNNDKGTYILIQNKLYDIEKSSADKYDVNKIFTRASLLHKLGITDYKIILMVNNKKLLTNKIQKAHHKDFDLVNDIFGLDELETWFQNLLNQITQDIRFEDFLKIDIYKHNYN